MLALEKKSCPRCAPAGLPKAVELSEPAHCEKCGGDFFPNDAAQDLVVGDLGISAAIYAQLEPLSQSRLLRCPSCGKPMATISLRGTEVDRCESCRGLWFDGGELHTVSKGKQGQPAPEGARTGPLQLGAVLQKAVKSGSSYVFPVTPNQSLETMLAVFAVPPALIGLVWTFVGSLHGLLAFVPGAIVLAYAGWRVAVRTASYVVDPKRRLVIYREINAGEINEIKRWRFNEVSKVSVRDKKIQGRGQTRIAYNVNLHVNNEILTLVENLPSSVEAYERVEQLQRILAVRLDENLPKAVKIAAQGPEVRKRLEQKYAKKEQKMFLAKALILALYLAYFVGVYLYHNYY